MSEIQIFNNPDFGEVRTLTINGEPWFVGKDVSTVLGYAKPTDAIRKRVDEQTGIRQKVQALGNIRSPSTDKESRILCHAAGMQSLRNPPGRVSQFP